LRAQGCASAEFLSQNGLKKISGNALAKMKRADFEKVINAFAAEATVAEIEDFLM
jgi:hypothetical protein